MLPVYLLVCCVNLFFIRAGNGVWSNSGIETIINEDSVICLSQHLTSFAVLVDTSGVTTVSLIIIII